MLFLTVRIILILKSWGREGPGLIEGEEKVISMRDGMAVVEGMAEVERSGRVYNNRGVFEVVVFVLVMVGGVILIF